MDRRTYIGGSAVAAVLGLAPSTWGRSTPLALYEYMIGDEPEPEISVAQRKFFARRKRQEPVIAEMLADEYGIEVTRLSMDGNPNRYIDPDFPFLAAEIDFEFPLTQAVRDHFPDRPELADIPDGTIVNGEIKTVHPFAARAWGEHGSEEVPIYYAAQIMHGLGVTRRPLGFCAALFGLDQLLCFPILADKETISAMREQCVELWGRVQRRDPPPPTTKDEWSRHITRLRGAPVELGGGYYDRILKLIDARALAKSAEQEIENILAELSEYVSAALELGPDDNLSTKSDIVLTHNGEAVMTWNRQRGAYLDQERLKAERPELVEKYTVERYHRVLREKRKGWS